MFLSIYFGCMGCTSNKQKILGKFD